MKLKLVIFLMLVSLVSCHTPSYVSDVSSTLYGLNFDEGTWLINEIDAPLSIKDKMLKLTEKAFKEHLKDRLTIAKDRTDFVLSYIPMNPNKLVLDQAKRESKFDYLINIKGNVIKNDIGDLQIGDIDSPQSNVSETIMEVYDLNTSEVIFSHRILGIVSVQKSTKDFAVTKGGNSLIVGGLKKILKKLD